MPAQLRSPLQVHKRPPIAPHWHTNSTRRSQEGDGGTDYTAAAPQANGADIVIDSADAELDFEEDARDSEGGLGDCTSSMCVGMHAWFG